MSDQPPTANLADASRGLVDADQTPAPAPLSAQPGFDLNEARAERDRLSADFSDAAREIARLMRELEFVRAEAKSIYDTCKQIERERDQIIAELPARDVRTRVETLREAADMLKMFPLGVAMFARLREIADAIEQSAVPAVEPSAVPAEGSGQGPELCPSCGATVWPAATPWTDSYRRLVLGKSAEGSGQRCPSRIALRSGEVLGCWFHDDTARHPHGTRGGARPGVRWSDYDDRVIGEPVGGSGHPRRHWTIELGAEEARRWLANEPRMTTDEKDAFRAQAEGSGHPRRPRCLCDAGGVQCGLSAGHVPPCTPMRPLDTPEGAIDRPHEINCHADRQAHWIDCECWCHRQSEGATDQ